MQTDALANPALVAGQHQRKAHLVAHALLLPA
jgi:hypothetical protein